MTSRKKQTVENTRTFTLKLRKDVKRKELKRKRRNWRREGTRYRGGPRNSWKDGVEVIQEGNGLGTLEELREEGVFERKVGEECWPA